MPTLKQLRQAHQRTSTALNEAQDRLGQSRDAAQQAVRDWADMEMRSLTEQVPDEDLAAARARVSKARDELAVIRDELKPHLSEDDAPAP